MGAVTQFRALGGVIGLAIASNVLNNHVQAKLSSVLTPQQLQRLLQNSMELGHFTKDMQSVVRGIYSDSYNLQMKVMIGFGAAQVLGLGLMWEGELRQLA